ncbi:MAG TPA: HAD hydrolase-like protein, partial [Thermoanaerobaculaceae bacterium]|nr:HAD hydrolase-like protein [Thermoanaerobaculaceae bacterium]
ERGSRLLNETLRGDQIVVVGDTAHDVRCGRAIGAKVLAVTTGGATREQLREHQPDWLVGDLREITPAQVCLGKASPSCGPGRGRDDHRRR